MRQLEEALTLLADRAEPLSVDVLITRIETELGWAPRAVAESEEPPMTTHKMIQRKPPTHEPSPPWWRRPVAALGAAVVVILIGVGIAWSAGVFGSDDAAGEFDEIATVHEVIDAFNAYDFDRYAGYFPEGATDIFAEDGPIGSETWRDGVTVDETIGTQWRLSACTLVEPPVRRVECTLTWETTLYTGVAGISNTLDAEFYFDGSGDVLSWTAATSPSDTGEDGREFETALCAWIETADPETHPALCPASDAWDEEAVHTQVVELARTFVAQSDVYPLSP